jgi:glutaredoxin
MSQKKVIVYSSSDCVVCEQVKDFLTKRGVVYTERNIVEDEAALDELSELGVLTTPATLIGDELVTGFSRKLMEQLLGQ